MSVSLILKYFPEITDEQKQQFEKLEQLYTEWNEKINVISRKDMDGLYEKHILHSLGIAKVMPFADGTKVLDIGTGGGFPGIPLAILFPEVSFTLIDSIGKKIKVVEAVSEGLGLKNVTAVHGRAEKLKEKFHFVVSRAVTQMPEFLRWLKGKFEKEQFNEKHNGVLYLKGGDLAEELAGLRCEIFQLKNYFEEEILDYMPALLTKDAIEFLGKKESETDISRLLEDVEKKEKEAESIQRLRDKYALNHQDVEYLEDCINDIDRYCKNSISLHSNALSDLNRNDASDFYLHSSSLRSNLEHLKNTVFRYDERAEILKGKVEELRRDFEIEKENLEEDGIQAIEAELSSYDSYINEGGNIRKAIDRLPEEVDALVSDINAIEESVSHFEEYIREEMDRRRKKSKEEEEEDDDVDLQAEIDAFYSDTAESWQKLHMPEYTGAVTKINKKNKKILQSIQDMGKKKLLELLLPKGRDCPGSDEIYGQSPFHTTSSANPVQLGLLGEYSLRYFHSYHKEDSEKTLPYSGSTNLELEYLLHGKKSDYQNLAAEVNSLLAVREAMNFIHILCSEEKRHAVEEFVYSFLAATANPVVIAVFSIFVIGVWAFAQSLLDVKHLLNEKRVPVMHSMDSWELSLSHLLDFRSYLDEEEGGSEENGLSYMDYLRGFLFTKGLLEQDKINNAMLSCMEKNIRNTVSEKESSFQIKQCLYYLSTDAGISSRHSLYHKGFLEMIGVNTGSSGYRFVLHSDYKYKNLSQ